MPAVVKSTAKMLFTCFVHSADGMVGDISLDLDAASFTHSWCFLSSFVFRGEMVTSAVEANVAQQEDVKNVLCMEGGHGETSYINNSQVQSRNLQMVVHVLKETLDRIRFPPRPEKLMTAADLGCSCGQNTVFVADVIVQHMTQLYVSRGHAAPEFCFYFSDLRSNDFNTLFHLLPDRSKSAAAGAGYFGAGVPGSFHERLFPERLDSVSD
ncbi:hypothetical protein EJB05_42975, partial [Eragrostis curvula]